MIQLGAIGNTRKISNVVCLATRYTFARSVAKQKKNQKMRFLGNGYQMRGPGLGPSVAIIQEQTPQIPKIDPLSSFSNSCACCLSASAWKRLNAL